MNPFSRRRRPAAERPPATPSDATAGGDLPLPPEEMRALVGSTDPSLFDNPTGAPVFPGLAPEDYPTVLDFGCGCGRLARQLIQQKPSPERYVGLDLHAGMINWCSQNLTPRAPGFTFHHHDVLYSNFNPGQGKPLYAPLPVGDDEFSLVVAISVFTHLTQVQTTHYLSELSRVLAPGGRLLSSWFLFDKRDFPMMQEDQNSLFINETDVRNAVIYDRQWLRQAAGAAGLIVFEAVAPTIRGYHWVLSMTQPESGAQEIELPEDLGQRGRRPPPQMPVNASQIGRDPAPQ